MARALRLPLVELTASGRFVLPGWPGLEVRRLVAPESQRSTHALYVLIAGELLIDLPDGSYLHLHPGEAADVEGEHALTPIEEAVVLEWTRSF